MSRRADRSARARALSRTASVRIRAVLCLGMLFAPAGVGTMAYWTDQATIESSTFSSGTLDLTVGATEAESGNLPGPVDSFEYSQLTIGNLVPGESIARPFVVRNSGTVPFTYNATIATSNDVLVAAGSGLRVHVYLGGTPTNEGSEANADRAGTCPGGVSVRDQAVSTSTSSVDLHDTDQQLAVDATQSYCAVILLHPNSPNALQGEITSLIIGLDAKQVGAP